MADEPAPTADHDQKREEVLVYLLDRVVSSSGNSSNALRYACAYAAVAGTLTTFGDAKS